MDKETIRNVRRYPEVLINHILRQRWTKYIPDKIFLKLMFYAKVHYSLNLNNPITFNEKLQWLKLNDRKSRYTAMVDKYMAKKIAEEFWGKEYIIPTLGIWSEFDQIDFSEFPNQFVLKCTHNSGGVVVVKNKNEFDINSARKEIEKSMNINYFYSSREWPYKNVKPRIIAEKYMGQERVDSLNDYKFMCFNGKVKCSFTCSNRFGENGLYVNFYEDRKSVV